MRSRWILGDSEGFRLPSVDRPMQTISSNYPDPRCTFELPLALNCPLFLKFRITLGTMKRFMWNFHVKLFLTVKHYSSRWKFSPNFPQKPTNNELIRYIQSFQITELSWISAPLENASFVRHLPGLFEECEHQFHLNFYLKLLSLCSPNCSWTPQRLETAQCMNVRRSLCKLSSSLYHSVNALRI